MTDKQAMDLICAALSRPEPWSADTLDDVAHIVCQSGREIDEL